MASEIEKDGLRTISLTKQEAIEIIASLSCQIAQSNLDVSVGLASNVGRTILFEGRKVKCTLDFAVKGLFENEQTIDF